MDNSWLFIVIPVSKKKKVRFDRLLSIIVNHLLQETEPQPNCIPKTSNRQRSEDILTFFRILF